MLVEAREQGLKGENFYAGDRNPPYWHRVEGATDKLLLRRSVAEKLLRVESAGRRGGAGTVSVRRLAAARGAGLLPRCLDAAAIAAPRSGTFRRAPDGRSGTLWSAPSADENSPAPHATGAAVDLTLKWKDGETLWMGSLFDDVTQLAAGDRFESLAADNFSFSDQEARANRRLLHWLMTEEGFAGHPDEWWHFSWGDQMWAALTGAGEAHYGLAPLP